MIPVLQRWLMLLLLVPAPTVLCVAAELPRPRGNPILTISGAIAKTNDGQAATLDLEMLERLPRESFTTKTPWHDGETRFTGVRLDRLLELVGAQGTRVTARALNDYVTTIPIEDFTRFGTLLAYQRDGKYMSIREKGPLFIIYPFDRHRELQTQTYFGRSAWQVSSIVVE